VTAITSIDPHIQDGYSEQFGLQIERGFGGHASATAGYSYLRGHDIIMSRNINVPTLTAAQAAALGVPNLGRPDPNFGNISQYQSVGDSWFNGLTLSLGTRPAAWGGARFSYTLSKALDDAGNAFFQTPQDNFNLRDDRGLSDNDQRHRLVLSGSFETPSKTAGWSRRLRGFQLSYIFTAASRLPFNVLLGSDRNLDTNNNDRPAGVGRNTGKGFSFSSLDLRLRRHFKLSERLSLDVSAEGFNILNRANLAVPNNVFGSGTQPSATFGQPTAAFDPRQFQFGLRLNF